MDDDTVPAPAFMDEAPEITGRPKRVMTQPEWVVLARGRRV